MKEIHLEIQRFGQKRKFKCQLVSLNRKTDIQTNRQTDNYKKQIRTERPVYIINIQNNNMNIRQKTRNMKLKNN